MISLIKRHVEGVGDDFRLDRQGGAVDNVAQFIRLFESDTVVGLHTTQQG